MPDSHKLGVRVGSKVFERPAQNDDAEKALAQVRQQGRFHSLPSCQLLFALQAARLAPQVDLLVE